MRFYASKVRPSNYGRGGEYMPEKFGPVCVNPYYKTSLLPNTAFMIDSGAFQDVRKCDRLSFHDALKRQLDFEKSMGGIAERIVSYDWLVDEQMDGGKQIKKRVNLIDSEAYIEETIKAAEYMSSMRSKLSPRNLILSCQGTTVEQYLYCAENVLNVCQSNDIIGIGGFCIISQQKIYENQFYEVIKRLFPLMSKRGVLKAHIFGVGMFRVLIQAECLARQYGIELSYDTSAYEFGSIMGRVFNPTELVMTKVFSKKQKFNGYLPGALAEFNVSNIHHFWNTFDDMYVPDSFSLGIEDIPEKKGSLDRWL